MTEHRVLAPAPAIPGVPLKGPASYFASIEKNYGSRSSSGSTSPPTSSTPAATWRPSASSKPSTA